MRRFGAAFRSDNGVGSPDEYLSRLDDAARSLAVYASPRELPVSAQDSLPAGGQPLPGRTPTCWVQDGRFQVLATSSIPPPQALTWRNIGSSALVKTRAALPVCGTTCSVRRALPPPARCTKTHRGATIAAGVKFLRAA